MDDCPTARERPGIAGAGYRLSMDDFGTGYSSLSHLARLPVTELKIDRSFIAELEANENAAHAGDGGDPHRRRAWGCSVVAEGVETDAQRRFLQALDCDVLQGFLFSKALPPADSGLVRTCAAAHARPERRLGAGAA